MKQSMVWQQDCKHQPWCTGTKSDTSHQAVFILCRLCCVRPHIGILRESHYLCTDNTVQLFTYQLLKDLVKSLKLQDHVLKPSVQAWASSRFQVTLWQADEAWLDVKFNISYSYLFPAAVSIYNLMSKAMGQCSDDIHYHKKRFQASMKASCVTPGS